MSRWPRIEAIFAEALDLPTAEREAYLDRACAGASDLRTEVESLLAAEAGTPSTFLGRPLDLGHGSAGPPPVAGDQVGPYRLLQKIGEGGMGVVYLGERADGAFDRRVAVKVLRHGLEDDATVLRFDLERRILASLDHPGIARLLDGGTTPAGSPFVVMELVEGQPIDRYCEDRALSSTSRVDLLLEVCDAVEAAHQRLVVHRDIKPSNVWVDEEGRPKLLDFGIAKILAPEPAIGAASSTTAGWQRLLTPSHASPEQVRGEPITVATDVYLLGILLYELLTGRLPHLFPSRSLVEVERILTTETPEPPSRVLSRRWAEGDTGPTGVAGIDTDLDHIALEALRSEPAERYASVRELADDLRRFRQGRPIRARQGSRRYWLRKQILRHWRPLAATALALALLVAFAVDRAIQVERREEALRRAELHLARATAFSDFFEGLFWEANPRAAKGRELTVIDVLDRGTELLGRGGLGPPELEAEAHALFGRIRLDLGDYEAARNDLQTALDLFATLDEPDPALRLVELQARGDLALVGLHQVSSPEAEGASEELATALADARFAYEQSRWLRSSDPARALELTNPLAEIYCQLEQWDQAAPLTTEAMELVRLAGEPRTHSVAETLGRRALLLKNREGDLAAAHELYSRALEILVEIEGPVHPEVANLHNQLALVAEEAGDLEVAERRHRDALQVLSELYPQGHSSLRRSLAHLGRVLLLRDDRGAAIDVFRRLSALSLDLYGPTGGWTVKHRLDLAQLLIESSRNAEAEPILRAQLTPEQRAARPVGSRLIVLAEGLLGAALLAQDDLSGEPLLRGSLQHLREHPEGYEEVLRWLESAAEALLPEP